MPTKKSVQTKLTKNFTLEELCHSDTALSLGIQNLAQTKQLQTTLTLLATHILQPIRDHFKKPVKVNSGYRSRKLEEHLYRDSILSKPKSMKDSWFNSKSHPKGEAADIKIKGIDTKDIYEYILKNLEYDQVFLEKYKGKDTGWVHVSYRNRKQSGLIG